MQILEVENLNPETNFSYVAPFVAEFRPAYNIIDPVMIAIFPFLENNLNRVWVNGFTRGPFVNYSVVTSYADCLLTEASIYWDHDNQIGYVHFEHEYYYDSDNYSYSTYELINDLDIVYIDNQESLPLLISVPEISKQQDLVNYDLFALNEGSAVVNNTEGNVDHWKDTSLFGNTVFNSYIDPDDIYTDETGTKYADRSAIKRLSAYYIDDDEPQPGQWTLVLKDPRGRQNVEICTDLYLESEYQNIADEYKNQPIALWFGQCREYQAVPVDSDDPTLVNPRYRAGLSMSDYGTIQVLQDKTWVTVTPILTESNGEFVLFGSDALNADGEVLECRLLDATGIPVTYGSDPIKWMNDYYNFTTYTDSFYDTDEWETESATLAPIGIIFDEQMKLFEAIKLIQSGCNYGFRYDYNNENKITLRLDREDRELAAVVDNVNIANRWVIPLPSDREQVFSYVDVTYYPGFGDSKAIDLVQNSDWLSYQQTTRQAKRLPVTTYLVNQADAEERAALDALRFRGVPRIATLEITCETKEDRDEFLSLRIYDIIRAPLTFSDDVDLDAGTIGGREYWGFQNMKILSVAPSASRSTITVTGKVLPDYIPWFVFRDTGGTDLYRDTGSSDPVYRFGGNQNGT